MSGVFCRPAALRWRTEQLRKRIQHTMSSKSHMQKHTRPTMSPLLRALTFSRAAHGPVTQAILLRCYTGLDAFRRGHGSRELFTTLGQQLLVAEELCRFG